MQSHEISCPAEAPCEISDPAVQVLWQRGRETNREPEYEFGGIKKTLVIDPSHPSDSGEYYCATADDVAQLIVTNQGDFIIHSFVCTFLFSNIFCASQL